MRKKPPINSELRAIQGLALAAFVVHLLFVANSNLIEEKFLDGSLNEAP